MVLALDQTNLKTCIMMRFLFAMYVIATSLLMTAQTPDVVVSPSLCDVIYRGVPNPILIGANAFSVDSLEFAVSNGHNLHCTEPGRCELTPSLDRSISTATVMVRQKGHGEKADLVFEKTFRIEDIPDPTLCFAGKPFRTTPSPENCSILNAKFELSFLASIGMSNLKSCPSICGLSTTTKPSAFLLKGTCLPQE